MPCRGELEWGEFEGKRTRIGVLEVDNNSSSSSFKVTDSEGNAYESEWSLHGDTVPVNGIEAMVTDTMSRTGRFRLVERATNSDVLGEHDLASSGRGTAVRNGSSRCRRPIAGIPTTGTNHCTWCCFIR